MKRSVAIIGGGPTGLMAAYILSKHKFDVTIYERKPTLGRKFLLAGRGGLNITHSENIEEFLTKYGKNSKIFKPILDNFSQKDLINFCEMLGEKTFVGSSGRVFPKSFKASPLLRSWLTTLNNQNVKIKINHDWVGWEDNKLFFKNGLKKIIVDADITLLALGGLSWPKLGSDGSWIKILKKDNIKITKIQPTNCGFFVKWSNVFKKRFAGHPLKSVKLIFKNKKIKGEFIITKDGIEGGIIYSVSSILRENINEMGSTEIIIDLKPDFSIEKIKKLLLKPRLKLTTSNYLRKTLNLSEVAIGLLMEFKNKKKARSAAEMLNGQPVGGKRRSAHYSDLWNIRYLPKFKWDNLMEEIEYQKAAREQRQRLELEMAKKERDFYMARVEQAKMIASMEERRKKRAEENPDSAPESPEEQMRMAKLREKQEKSRLLRTFKQRKALDDPSIDSKQGMMSLDMIKSLFGNPIKKKSEVGIFQ